MIRPRMKSALEVFYDGSNSDEIVELYARAESQFSGITIAIASEDDTGLVYEEITEYGPNAGPFIPVNTWFTTLDGYFMYYSPEDYATRFPVTNKEILLDALQDPDVVAELRTLLELDS